MYVNYKLNNLLLWVFTLIAIAHTQTQLDDVCTLDNGKQGKCLYFKDCPSAIALVRRQGRPTNCGFDGTQPIICCELNQSLTRLRVGDVSKQKCNETYFGLRQVGLDRRRKRQSENEPDEDDASSGFSNVSVVGGIDSLTAEEFSHMAALGYGNWPEVTWACGGSLISEKFVLTAAHCVDTNALGRVKYIRLGDLDLKSTTDIARPQDVTISRIHKHPDYRAPLVYNDIALLELATPANINNFVRPACLHTDMEIPADYTWIATGWGATSYGGPRSDILQQVNLKRFTFEECQTVFSTTSNRRLNKGIDSKSQICAGETEKDTCQGDSGGPLQIKSGGYLRGYTVIGVTSFGKACGITTNPAVYTRVSNYIEWIEGIVWPTQ